MKTLKTSSFLLTGLAIGALAFLAPNLTWADGKGASKLMFSSQSRTETQSAPAKPTMSCARCTDVYAKVSDTSAKGMRPELKTVAVHKCPACSTTITAVGAGKAKADQVVHSCGMATSCCVR